MSLTLRHPGFGFPILTKQMNLKKLEQRKLGYAALDVMEQHLATFFVEERYTIADIMLIPT